MKRKYNKPSISIDVFEANEYIATCAVAVCNIDVSECGNKNVMYNEKNNIAGYQENKKGKKDKRISITNIACNHKFEGRPKSLKEYMYDPNGTNDGVQPIKVYYWKTGRNHHVTTGYQTTGSSTC